MRDDDLAVLPLHVVASAIAERRLSPVEVVDALLARVERVEPRLHTYVHLDADAARASARRAEQAVTGGGHLGPLHGIPVSLKDVFHHGPTRAGSLAPLPRHAGGESAVASQLERAGAIIVGKAATYEFALGAQTSSGPYEPTRNPWNPALDAGGSSSGSAAGVAASLAYASLGSDTAGSGRYPAAACGVVGLKPTYDLVDRDGLVPLSWSFDHPAVLARCIADAGRVLAAHLPPGATEGLLSIDRDIAGVRLGVPRSLFAASCEPAVLEVFEAACLRLRELGATVEDVELRTDATDVAAAMWPILLAEMAAAHHEGLQDPAAAYGRQVRSTMEAGYLVSGVDYLRAQQLRRTIASELEAALATVDQLVLPTSSARPGAVLDTPPATDEYASGENVSVYTAIANLTGGPAVTLPCGFAPDGLPLGLQLLGPLGGEVALLRTAAAFEAAMGWYPHYATLPHAAT